MKKSLKILLAVFVLLLTGVGVLIWHHQQNKPVTEAFATVPDKLNILRDELKHLLTKTVDYEVSTLFNQGVNMKQLDPWKIVNCVQKSLKKSKLPLTTFSMDGNKMDDPIVKMYHTDPEVFKVLGKCRFLELIGRIVAVAAWTGLSKGGKVPKSHLKHFVNCLDSIVWTDIKVWETMSDPKGEVMMCVKS